MKLIDGQHDLTCLFSINILVDPPGLFFPPHNLTFLKLIPHSDLWQSNGCQQVHRGAFTCTSLTQKSILQRPRGLCKVQKHTGHVCQYFLVLSLQHFVEINAKSISHSLFHRQAWTTGPRTPL